MRTRLIKEKQTGVRQWAGACLPVVAQLERIEYEGLIIWQVTHGLCNGIPEGCDEFASYQEALWAWTLRTGDGDGPQSR